MARPNFLRFRIGCERQCNYGDSLLNHLNPSFPTAN